MQLKYSVLQYLLSLIKLSNSVQTTD